MNDSPGQRKQDDIPERRVTFSQCVGFNINAYRKAAGLTQEQLGERLGGWSGASVSAAERSWEGKRVRKFDVDELVQIAAALGVPVLALLLPPSDAGITVRYAFGDGVPADLMGILVPSYGGDAPVVAAFRERLLALGTSSSIDPGLAGEEAGQIERRARIEADVLLAQASQKANWIIADAKTHAQTLLHNAEDWHTIERADEAVTDLIEQARDEVNATLERARREADDILIKARRQSEQITSDARLRAESLERDAKNRHRQAMGTLPQTRKELEQRVDDLRAFEREYRRRLIEYMEGQVRDLRAGAADSGTFPAISTSPQQHVVTGP